MNPGSPTSSSAAWRKSSYSTCTGACVEVAPTAGGVLVRDSKHPVEGTITFSRPAWAAFLAGAADGEFDSAGQVTA